MTGLCRQCYTIKINRRVLDRLEGEFKPLTANNGFIFNKYLESTRGRFVTDADVALARKFAKYLAHNSIGPLSSWSDILSTSKLVNLRYNHMPKRGCPILQVGRKLDQLGLIAPLADEKLIERSQQMEYLREPIRTWAGEYFTEVTKAQPAMYGLCTITIIRRWVDHLGSTPFADATEDDAKAFINTLPATSLEQAGNLIRRMKSFYAWAVQQSYLQANPFLNLRQPRVKKRCSRCGKERVFRHQGNLCGPCDGHARYYKKSKLFEREIADLPAYSRDIFSLFLRYLNRSPMEVGHRDDAKVFADFLRYKEVLPLLNSWLTVEKMSAELEDFASGFGGIKKGGPIMKAGYILQELGVLPIREDGYDYGVEKKILSLSQNLVTPVRRYVELLRRTRRNEKTVVAIVTEIKRYDDWLKENHDVDPWSASEPMARNYLAATDTLIIHAHQKMSRFYRFAKAERYVLSNPFEKIAVASRRQSLKVCSSEQIKKIQKFIKSPRSNPEGAMMLALVFYWGLTGKDMSKATVEFENRTVKIIFHRGVLTYGQNRYRRDQELRLPEGPQWFEALQVRFMNEWQEKFKQVRADLPRQPLILHPRGLHNRPLSTLCVRKRYYRAVEKAAGVKIPPNVLRRAGADCYAQQNATGLLQRLGWSKGHAFKFTWMPRQLFRP